MSSKDQIYWVINTCYNVLFHVDTVDTTLYQMYQIYWVINTCIKCVLFHVNIVNTTLYRMYYVQLYSCRHCQYMHFHLFFLHRLVKEITYREFQRYHGRSINPPMISDVDYESGEYVKCPMKWTKGALGALHEACEDYMVSLMEDANLLVIHAK